MALSESTLRKRADREGYVLRKSRGQGYMLADVSTGAPVLGWNYDADLGDVARFLAPLEDATPRVSAKEQGAAR